MNSGMNNRRFAMLGALAAVVGIVLYVILRHGGGSSTPSRTPSGSAVAVPLETPSTGPSTGTTTGPALPANAGADQNPKDYVVGDIRVRDHRTGDHKPLDVTPNPHPAEQRELPSALTHAISQQVKNLLYACAADLPKDARGTKPHLEGHLDVAIKDHTLSIKSVDAQMRDVDGPMQDSIKQCVEQKSVGLTAKATDEADLDSYGIQISFVIP